jgi:iron complex outermembrane recepter protein
LNLYQLGVFELPLVRHTDFQPSPSYSNTLTVGGTISTNNPNLKPEEIYSREITAERRFANGLARASLFREDRYDALVSQTNVSPVPPLTNSTSYVQNADHVRIYGIELATEWKNAIIPKLDLLANATLTDSENFKK